MSIIRAGLALVFTLFWTFSANAQSTVWIQVEAQPTLTSAQERVREYSREHENVAGFYLGSGWYGILLGPYTRSDAETLRRRLRRNSTIPNDSYIVTARNFGQQYWPIGVGVSTTAQPLPGENTARAEPEIQTTQQEPIEDIAPQAPDETLREARTSERALNRDEKKLLQVAMEWAGFYSAAIDGSFGRGTRNAMQAWQEANNHTATGVLTTAQRVELIGAYNAVLDGIGLEQIADTTTGINMLMPMGVVDFAHYEPPFARYKPKGDIPAQLLLISQPGDQDRFFGLYEILQTLEIIPVDGPRNRSANRFEIEGQDETQHTYVFAQLKNGEIKGYALVWPAGDDARRIRVLAEMKASFATLPGVLDPALAVPDETQAVDLVSGLDVRKPQKAHSGFYIDTQGSVVTTLDAVSSCQKITIGQGYDANIVHQDEALGLAVLQPTQALAPLDAAAFQTAVPRLQSRVAVAGYPYGGVLVSPTLSYGVLADIRGLNGEDRLKRLTLKAENGNAGGPVFDDGGAVLGMLLPRETQEDQVLPPDVAFFLETEEILKALSEAEITVETTDQFAFMPPETLTLQAADITVLVRCW